MTAEAKTSTSYPAVATTDEAAYTRLHITPLDPELLKLVLPAAIRPLARDVSFHTVQAFPEKRYGFVELPAADAAKIKKKLHGAVLRGSKIRIEPAREDDMPKPAGDAALAAAVPAKKDKKKSKDEGKKKRKRDSVEVSGVELEAGRKVKRGWTVPEEAAPKRDKGKKDKKEKRAKKEARSLYTDGPETLIKTVLPATAANVATGEAGKKRKKGKSREIVVHEFEKSTKFPTFLKAAASSSKSGPNLEYLEGKGWVDEDGNVVEKTRTKAVPPAAKEIAEAADDSTSSSGESSEEEESSAQSDVEVESGGDEEEVVASTEPKPEGQPLESPRPKSSGSGKSLTIKIPPPVTPAAGRIHPLEALYKRTKQSTNGTPSQDAASDAQPFSFFDADGDSEAPGSQMPPMTPFTMEEFERRRVRSAAPTPDTAHPNRTFKLWPVDGEKEDDIEEAEEDEDVEMGSSQPATGAGDGVADEGNAATGTGDFQSWFWEHRGDLNRAWKKRRKAAAKEKRYRENRSRAERAV